MPAANCHRWRRAADAVGVGRAYVSGAAGGAVAAVLSAAHAAATGRPRLAASCVMGAPRFAHASGLLAILGMTPYPGPVVVLARAVERAMGGGR